ncbi:MAG: hypothetical protein KW804_00470 [Candidatus Doudnabacteria bacterium]|nr:hypothetical protein [Candidatus Doudnabacteria bacterium]
MGLITRLQNKPYQAKLRILWGIVFVSAVILIIIFGFNIKHTLSGVNTKKLLESKNSASNTALTTTPYAFVERVERTEGSLKVFFNFNNTTDDILSISKPEDITLTLETTRITPKSITDRQGKPFVQKILSHTQNFGVLNFDQVNVENAELSFDMMSFEKNPSNNFKQTIKLDLVKLSQPIKVRN